MRRYKKVRSFTLVESMVALTVLVIAIGAILTPITLAVEQKVRAARQAVAVVLAEEIIDECLSKTTWCFESPINLGHEGDETTRAAYDERTDFHNLNETASQLGTVHGPTLASASFPKLTRRTWLQVLYLPGESASYPQDFMMLTVRVYDGDQELVTVRRLINNVNHAFP
jgi:hypothetical protein